jgi:hypothetical protein
MQAGGVESLSLELERGRGPWASTVFRTPQNRFQSPKTPRKDVVNSLPAIDAPEHQLFDKLLWGLVISTIFLSVVSV